MKQHQLVCKMALVCAVTIAFGACNRKPTAPERQTTTGAQLRAEPITVTGCLKSGVLAEDTFVLIVSQTEGAGGTSTYQLTALPNLNLRDHVGKQVELSGTLRSEQAIASRGDVTTQKAAKGTSGTPAVETQTDIDIKRLEVASVKPVASACQP
jgi:hypothetical protein